MEVATDFVNELAAEIENCDKDEDIIRRILEKVCRLYKAHGGVCLLINGDGSLLKSVCSIGIGEELGQIILNIDVEAALAEDDYIDLNKQLLVNANDKISQIRWLPLNNVFHKLIGFIVITYLYRREIEKDDDIRGKEGILSYISALIDNIRWNKYDQHQFAKENTVELFIKENKDQVRQTQKMEALGTLAGGIAHDFNNILTGIVGYTELSLEDAPRDSMIYQSMMEILKLSERAKDLVSQILSFSRKNADLNQRLDLIKIISETLKMLRATFPSTITIEENFKCSSAYLYADPTEIQQLIMNISINAEQAMREKCGKLYVTLDMIENVPGSGSFEERLKPGKYIKLSFRDSGCGMDIKTRDRIFEPFFTTKGAKEGTGLGLSVVHGIVNRNKGIINVESEPGKGSNFDVFLPV